MHVLQVTHFARFGRPQSTRSSSLGWLLAYTAPDSYQVQRLSLAARRFQRDAVALLPTHTHTHIPPTTCFDPARPYNPTPVCTLQPRLASHTRANSAATAPGTRLALGTSLLEKLLVEAIIAPWHIYNLCHSAQTTRSIVDSAVLDQ